MSFPILKKITTPEEQRAAIAAAQADNDNMIFPTHVVLKDGKIVGSWCIGGIPFVMLWHSTEHMKARDSMIMNNTVGALMNDRGVAQYCLACNSGSPFIGYMDKFGYSPVWPTNLFYKRTT